MQPQAPLVLLILDGFGYSEKISHNAIAKTHTPHWDNWWKNNPHALLEASGESVGLPHLQMGNSEVGHMHIGAGRVIPQDFTRINQAIAHQSLDNHAAIQKTIQALKQSQRTLHIMGLTSPGGVHSHEDHLFALIKLCIKHQFSNIILHLFLDGRDTPPKSALSSIERLTKFLDKIDTSKTIRIGSVCGRFYAMDRDKRWERVAPVYQLLTTAQSEQVFDSATDAIHAYYQQDIFDEFIPPTRIGAPHPIETGDAVFFFNFRADRARELTEAFVLDNFSGFTREKTPKLSAFISMTSYAEHLKTTPVFPPFKLEDTLGEVLSKHHLKQLRVAETEKYAHVTFFLNGGLETVFPGEERTLIPSPKVTTYNLAPKMSAPLVTEVIVSAIEHKTHDVIICNYANADMVGHTGDLNATCEAIAYLDEAMFEIATALHKVQGQMLITADHGNAEAMFDSHTNLPHTAHTTNPVPLLYVGPKKLVATTEKGSLIDIAPTLLSLLNIKPPSTMEGHNLFIAKT